MLKTLEEVYRIYYLKKSCERKFYSFEFLLVVFNSKGTNSHIQVDMMESPKDEKSSGDFLIYWTCLWDEHNFPLGKSKLCIKLDECRYILYKMKYKWILLLVRVLDGMEKWRRRWCGGDYVDELMCSLVALLSSFTMHNIFLILGKKVGLEFSVWEKNVSGCTKMIKMIQLVISFTRWSRW